MIVHFMPSRMTVTVHKKGKLVVFGAPSKEHSRKTLRQVARVIQKSDEKYANIGVTGFSVANVVAVTTIGYKVNMQKLAHLTVGLGGTFEPEIDLPCVRLSALP